MPGTDKYRSSQEKLVNEASNQLKVKNHRTHKETKHERVQAGGKNTYTQKSPGNDQIQNMCFKR